MLWTKEQQYQASRLAVAYEAFLQAPAGRKNARAVWASMLKSAQQNIGIELIKTDILELAIKSAETSVKNVWVAIR